MWSNGIHRDVIAALQDERDQLLKAQQENTDLRTRNGQLERKLNDALKVIAVGHDLLTSLAGAWFTVAQIKGAVLMTARYLEANRPTWWNGTTEDLPF